MSFALTDHDPEADDLIPEAPEEPAEPIGDQLRTEYGWHDVRSGLDRLLLGYAVLIGGAALCVGMVVVAVFELAGKPTGEAGKLAYHWVFYAGCGLFTLFGPIGYGMLVIGKWRCLMNAPERHGTRWFMFACMTCLLMGPALNFVSGMTGMKERPELKRGPESFKKIQFTQMGGAMQLAGGAIGLSALVFFMLFLRATARCFRDRGRVLHVTLYLVAIALLGGTTYYLVYTNPKLLDQRRVLIGIGGGYVFGFLWYLYLIISIRSCISNGMKQIRSPLET